MKTAKKVSVVKKLGVVNFINAITAPDGFSKELYTEQYTPKADKLQAVKFTNSDKSIEIKIIMGDLNGDWMVGSGHVDFRTSRGLFSFDRYGVEDSFYINPEDTPEKVHDKLVEQIQKVADTQARHERSETIPQIGFVITPERKAQVTKDLKAGKSATFTPSGFGTGYVLRQKRTGWSRPASAELARFFGCSQLWFETLDCD